MIRVLRHNKARRPATREAAAHSHPQLPARSNHAPRMPALRTRTEEQTITDYTMDRRATPRHKAVPVYKPKPILCKIHPIIVAKTAEPVVPPRPAKANTVRSTGHPLWHSIPHREMRTVSSLIAVAAQVRSYNTDHGPNQAIPDNVRALFQNVYDKLPLDHSRYTSVIEVPLVYRLLRKDDRYVLCVTCGAEEKYLLHMPLNPRTARIALASKEYCEKMASDIRSSPGTFYPWTLESVHGIRKDLDPGYQPL